MVDDFMAWASAVRQIADAAGMVLVPAVGGLVAGWLFWTRARR